MRLVRVTTGAIVHGLFILAAVGCSAKKSEDSADAGATKPAGTASAAPTASATSTTPAPTTTAPDAPPPDAGSPPPSDGGTNDSGTDAGPVSGAVTITSAVARATGRSGGDLRIEVSGGDTTLSAYGVIVRALDASNGPLTVFDGNWNGGPSTSERTVLFDPGGVAGQKTYARVVTVHDLMTQFPGIVKIGVSVVVDGAHSAETITSVLAQSVQGITQTCDPKVVTDRCAPGLVCTGMPAACATAASPTLAQFAYVPSASGPHMLFPGVDQADDLASMHVEFLDAQGKPLSIDMTGHNDMASAFELTVGAATSLGTFFFDNQAAVGFDSMVPQLAATPVGASSGSGTRVTAKLAAPPLKGAGQACDPRGFIGCTTGNLCAPAAQPGSYVCTAAATVLGNVAKAAPTLDPAKKTMAYGYAVGASLFEPPAGCLANGAKGRPEGVVKLHLASPVAALEISTSRQETNFDTVVYLLPGAVASAANATAIGCNDDTQGTSSTVLAQNLAAGDYTIVVDSVSAGDGEFAITIK